MAVQGGSGRGGKCTFGFFREPATTQKRSEHLTSALPSCTDSPLFSPPGLPKSRELPAPCGAGLKIEAPFTGRAGVPALVQRSLATWLLLNKTSAAHLAGWAEGHTMKGFCN